MDSLFEINWGPLATWTSCALALSIALFSEKWKRWQYKPAIALEAGDSPPLLQHFPAENLREWIMLRLRICNEGNDVAENVEVHLTDVSRVSGNGRFERDSRFVPVRLVWSHGGGALKENLSPQTSGFVDLGKLTSIRYDHQVPGAIHLIPPPTVGATAHYMLPWCKTSLKLCTEVESTTSIWEYPPESYRLSVAVACKRGVFWKGAIDLKFENITEEHDQNTGHINFNFKHAISCGIPQLGVEVCNCKL